MIHITGTFKEGSYATDDATGDFDYTYTEETGWSDDPNHPASPWGPLSAMVISRGNVGPPPGKIEPSFTGPDEGQILHTIYAFLNEFCETLTIDTDYFDDTETDDLGGQIIY